MNSGPKRGAGFLLVLCLAVLLGAGGIIVWGRFRGATEVRLAGILDQVPRSFMTWTVQEHRVAESPEMKRAVAELLNYDEAIFRTFHKEGIEISIYAAYWRPRKYPARLVAQHVPEVCWPANGWKLTHSDYNRLFSLPDGRGALPVQAVMFDHETTGKKQHVWYWHVSGGELSGFASGPQSHSIFILDSFWKDVRVANAEQVFIRLASNQPWAGLNEEPLLKEILTSLAPALARQEMGSTGRP